MAYIDLNLTNTEANYLFLKLFQISGNPLIFSIENL